MGFFDQPVPKDVDIKYSKNIIKNPILYTDDRPIDLYILVEKPYSKKLIKEYVKLIKKEAPNIHVQVLCTVSLYVKDKDIKGGVSQFYIDNKIDINAFIPPYGKVIADRRSVVALNESDDLEVEGFYDIVFNNTYYYNPQYKLTVFPVDPITYWINKTEEKVELRDNWNRFFHFVQIKRAYLHNVKKKRHKKVYIEEPYNPNQFLKEWMNYDGEVAWDIETRYMNPWSPDSKILEITMSFDGKIGYYLPWDEIDTKLLSQFLRNKKQILQNGKYDAKFLILNGVDRDAIHIYHDTWNGSHVINEMQRSSLKSDAWIYTDMGGYDNELDSYVKKYPSAKSNYELIPKEIRKPYAVKDAIVTFRNYKAQQQKFKEINSEIEEDLRWTVTDYFYKIVMPTVNMFLDVELEGMIVDWGVLERLSGELDESIQKARKNVCEVLGITDGFINLDGPDLGILLELKGWPNMGRSKDKPNRRKAMSLSKYFERTIDPNKGVYLTGKDPLSKWRKIGYEKEVDAILHYRELTTLMETFVGRKEDGSGYWQYRQTDDRLHSTFGPMLTHSHRNWSREPNLQNCPKQGDRAKWYRQIFAPPSDDYYFVEFDAAGLQLRIGAILSGDKTMADSFINQDGDLHSVTANKVLMNNISLEEFKQKLAQKDKDAKSNRFKAKGINFQLEFGATAFNFASTVIEKEWSEEEIDDYIKQNRLQNVVDRRLSLLHGDSGPNGEHAELQNSREDIFKNIGDKDYFAKCWAVASHVRDKHFEVYKGLGKWTEYVPAKASKQGYVISPFGAIRRLPELLHQGNDDRSSHIKNLKNISLNSPVQNYEVVLMMKVMVAINKFVKNNNMLSKVIGNVHDSVVMYIHKNELESIYWKAKEVFEEDIPENKGIPMLMEFDVADYFGKGEVWGFGEEITEQEKGKILADFFEKISKSA